MNSQGGSNLRQSYGWQVKLASSIVLIVFIVTFSPVSISKTQAASISAQTLVELTNLSRASAGLASLSVNSKLVSSAQAKAADMLEHDYFAHTSPQGLSPWYWFAQAGYDYSYAGENLAIDFFSSSGVHNAWMASPSHRANILDPNYTEIGIAAEQNEFQGKETIVVVQHFARPKSQAMMIASKQIKSQTKSASQLIIEATQPPTNNLAKKPGEVLAETKIEILCFTNQSHFSILDLLFPPFYLYKKWGEFSTT